MPSRSALLSLLTLGAASVAGMTVARQHARSDEPPALAQNVRRPNVETDDDDGERRCAYLGQWGSFHLLGSGGSAAYTLGPDKFIANLTFVGKDPSYWYYRPTNGDPHTKRWAFARQPYCGKYWVWRHSHGAWKRYEATRAWGNDLGTPTTAQTAIDVVDQLQLRVQDLENRVKALESTAPTPPTISALPTVGSSGGKKAPGRRVAPNPGLVESLRLLSVSAGQLAAVENRTQLIRRVLENAPDVHPRTGRQLVVEASRSKVGDHEVGRR